MPATFTPTQVPVTDPFSSPVAFDPNTRSTASVFDAASTQVRADFAKDTLAQKHASGEISDKAYINGLQNLASQYRNGIGIQRGVQSETTTAAQNVATNYVEEINQNQTKFLDDALRRFNKANTDFANGVITESEFKTESSVYKAAISGQRSEPTAQKTTDLVLNGKFWDQYKSGRVRDIMREKQVKAAVKKIKGKAPNQATVDKYAGSEGTIDYIKKRVGADSKKIKKDVNKERAALQYLTKTLGRIPTKAEIEKKAYGI